MGAHVCSCVLMCVIVFCARCAASASDLGRHRCVRAKTFTTLDVRGGRRERETIAAMRVVC